MMFVFVKKIFMVEIVKQLLVLQYFQMNQMFAQEMEIVYQLIIVVVKKIILKKIVQ
jgi:hypothetical protein